MVESRDGIEEQTGTGVPRSADETAQTPSVERDGVPDLNVNRSGSGGTGGPATPDEADGAADETMEEMLGE
jgi:hypothetical protein